MKLIIEDKGDPSVGVWSREYSIDCPFEKDEVEKEDLEYFRNEMQNAFQQFAEGKLTADYDFELEASAQYEKEIDDLIDENIKKLDSYDLTDEELDEMDVEAIVDAELKGEI